MGKESYVGVTGTPSLRELVGKVRDILDLPEGELGDGYWSASAVIIERIVRPEDVEYDYDYEVMIYAGSVADNHGREVFDELARSTDWALWLQDDRGGLLDKRVLQGG